MRRRMPTRPFSRMICAAALAATGWLFAQAPQVKTGGSTFFEREGGRARTRFHGDVTQQPDGKMLLTKFRMETLTDREAPDLRIEAPQCFFDLPTKSAWSSGALKVSRADGFFTLEGEGFTWNQKDTRLVISNSVRAVIRRNLFSSTNSLTK